MARLDRLGPAAREVAQVGAVIGREFSHELLAAVADSGEDELAAALDQLAGAGLVFRRGEGPEAELPVQARAGARRGLRHAPARPAAAAPRRRRARPGGAVPRAGRDVARAGRAPPDRGRRGGARGALLARGRPARGGALGRPRGGRPPPAGPGAARGPAGLRRAGPHRARVPARDRDAADRALTAGAGSRSRPPTSGPARSATAWATTSSWARPCSAWPATASSAARRGRRSAWPSGAARPPSGGRSPVDRLLAHRAMGAALMQLGELRQARAELEAIPALYDPERDRGLAARCVTDPRASGLSFLALVLWIMGYPDQARRTADEASRHAAELQHANTTGHVLCHAGGELAQLLGDAPAARRPRRGGDGARGRARHADVARLRPGPARLGRSPRRGGPRTARRSCARASRSWTRSARVFHRTHHLGLLADIHARLGDPAAGLRLLEEAYDEVARTEVRLFEAELRRLEGELRLLAGRARGGRGGVLRRGARRGAPAGGQVVRAARRDRPRPPVAGPGEACGSARPARPGPRLVHRRVRHAGPAGCEGIARRAPMNAGYAMRELLRETAEKLELV